MYGVDGSAPACPAATTTATAKSLLYGLRLERQHYGRAVSRLEGSNQQSFACS